MQRVVRLASLILGLALITGSAVALWISGFQLNLAGSMTSGTQPELISCDWDNVDFNDSINFSKTCSFENSDGLVTMQFSMVENSVSTDTACVYQEFTDVTYFVKVNSESWEILNGTSTPEFTINPGTNNINLRAIPSEYRCPAIISATLSGEIV